MKPAAWLYEWGEGKRQASTSNPAEMAGWLDYAHVTPLIRLPMPLTDAQIDAITDEQWGNGCSPSQYMAHRAYARAIERAMFEVE